MTVKSRQKHTFRDGIAVVGSAQFSAPIDVRSTANFLGTETHSGVVTQAGSVSWVGAVKNINAQVSVNTVGFLKASSAAAQFAGYTTLGSGAVSVVVSTTAVKSNAMFWLTPILQAPVADAQASGSIPGALTVTTITEAKCFTLGWMGGGVAAYGGTVAVAWKIELQA